GDLLAELDRCHAPGTGDDMARPYLEADDVLTVFRVAFEDAVEVDITDVAQFRHPVAGDEPDRAEVQERLDALSRRLNDVFAEAVEIGLAGRARVDQCRHAALG